MTDHPGSELQVTRRSAGSAARNGVHPLFTSDGDRFVPTEVARGPWSPDSLHGGPVAALLARAVERHDVDEPVLLTRLTLDILKPVPLEPLLVATRTVRPGRKVQLVEATVTAGGREICRALALRVRQADVAMPDDLLDGALPGPTLPPPGPSTIPKWGWQAFHNEGVEMRWVVNRFDAPGPGVVWIRLRGNVVDDEPPSGIQRVVAAADFGNGVSKSLPMEGYLFVNPDLTVYVLREPVGEWVCLDSRTLHGPTGTGLAESALYDGRGQVGRSAQSLLLDFR